MIEETIRILADHLERRPFMKLQDIYKLRHQGAWGPGFQVSDKDKAWNAFRGEWKMANKLAADPVGEVLSSRFVRVNLGPYSHLNYDPGELFSAWLSGTAEKPDGEAIMHGSYQALLAAIETKVVHYNLRQVESFENELQKLGYPSLSHSEAYIQQYRPVYRVVLRAVLSIPV